MMKPPVTPRRAWSRETTITQCRAGDLVIPAP
jgi:hypothetical protein